MEQDYIKAVTKKLQKQGLSEEEIKVELNKIINRDKDMEKEEDVVVVDEINMPVVEETPDADIEKLIDADEEEVDTEEVVA